MIRQHLTDFELMILLAILRVGDEAYGVPIARELEETAGRTVLLGAIYAALDRLEKNGLVSSSIGDPTPERGRRLPLPGEAFPEVAFDPAQARDPDGTATFSPATITPGAPVLRQVRFAGDFEGRVSFGLGVAGRGGFRVSELRNPTRVAVDVR